jgi:hypothetical protein
VQKFDGSKEGKFDGSPPDPYKAPSWRGVLLMLLMTAVLLALVLYAFLSVFAQPDGPSFRVPPIIR